MNLSSVELDRIVKAVLAQLGDAARSGSSSAVSSSTTASSSTVSSHAVSSSSAVAAPAADPSELSLRDRVITASLLENEKLSGIRSLRVRSRAVVTPAAMDVLRARNVRLVRDAGSSNSTVKPSAGSKATESSPQTKLAPILVTGGGAWFGSLARHLCPKQTIVSGSDDANATSLISQHFERGGRYALWVSPAPFAASVTLQGKVSKRAVQLPSMLELSSALKQALPEIIVVDSGRWTTAAVGNLVRQWLRSN
ncbi:MAG: hypothetical protein U0892_11105 [Pirellulales bacterium]